MTTSRPGRPNRLAIVAAIATAALAGSALLVAGPVQAGAASSGDGGMIVTPASVVAGSSGNTLVFTFSADNGKDFAAGSIVTVVVPAGWTPPSATSTAPGYTTASASSGTCAPGSPAISGTGPWTIQVAQTCSNKGAFTITYGASSGTRVTAPSVAGATTFATASRNGASGSAVALFSGSPSVTVVAGAANKVAFVQGPSNAAAGLAMAPAVTAQLQDQYANPVATGGTIVTLTPSQGVINAGATASTNTAGLATFSGVVINTANLGLTLTASTPGLAPSASSATFNVTVTVTNAAAALTSSPSDGSGAGVKSVSYYSCPGYSGACIAGTPWTLIGTSTNAASNFPVTWTSQPPNGPYRLVLLATDNVTNTSNASASIPVTVAN